MAAPGSGLYAPAVEGSRSRISRVEPDRVEVRGRDLAGDLMGSISFTEYFHLLLTGREPTDDERFFLDLLLVAIAEHGMMPSNVAARMTLAADPRSLHGTSEDCARLLEESLAAGRPADEVVRGLREAGEKVPGFGHPVHRALDPRAERILELADGRGVSGAHVAYARELRDAVVQLPMNVAMAIAAVMLDLGFGSDVVKAVPILARTAGLLAHLADERVQPVGFLLARAAEQAVEEA